MWFPYSIAQNSEGCPNGYAPIQFLPALEVIFSKPVSLKGWHASNEHWCSSTTRVKILSSLLKTATDALIRIVQWWQLFSKKLLPVVKSCIRHCECDNFVLPVCFLNSFLLTHILKTQKCLKLKWVFIGIKGGGKWELQCCVQRLEAVMLHTVVV